MGNFKAVFPAPTAIFQYFYGFDFLIEVQEHSRCGWILTILVLLKRFQMNGETNKHFTYELDVSKLHLATLSNNGDVAKSRLPDNFTGWKTKTWSNVEGVTTSHKTRVKCPKLNMFTWSGESTKNLLNCNQTNTNHLLMEWHNYHRWQRQSFLQPVEGSKIVMCRDGENWCENWRDGPGVERRRRSLSALSI